MCVTGSQSINDDHYSHPRQVGVLLCQLQMNPRVECTCKMDGFPEILRLMCAAKYNITLTFPLQIVILVLSRRAVAPSASVITFLVA